MQFFQILAGTCYQFEYFNIFFSESFEGEGAKLITELLNFDGLWFCV